MYSIKPLPILTITMDKGCMTYLEGYGKKIELSVNVWFIDGPDLHIIIDTGAPAEEFKKRGRICKEIITLEEALNKVGLTPRDVDIIISTHLHYDHILNAKICKNARIFVQEKELKFALNPHPLFKQFYPPINFLSDLKFKIIKGNQKIVEGIEVFPTPGHTPGCQSVAIETRKGLAVITGFCCIMDNFTSIPEYAPNLPFTIPGIHFNVIEAFDSVLKVKTLADILIPLHERPFRDKIP